MLSLLATSSLLIYLAVKKLRELRIAPEKSSLLDSPRKLRAPSNQGLFWLVNLFVAGFPFGVIDLIQTSYKSSDRVLWRTIYN
jgi:hypothetical protein